MSDSSLQVVVFVLGLVNLLLAGFILLMDARRLSNIILSVVLFLSGLQSIGAAGIAGADTLEQAVPWTGLVAFGLFQSGTGLLLLTLNLFRPHWLRRVYIGLPLAGLIVVPVLLLLIDMLFQTGLLYSGLDPSIYAGGYVEPRLYLDTPLARLFRMVNVVGLQIVEIVFLVYLLIRPSGTRLRRAAAMLLSIALVGLLANVILSDRISTLSAFVLLQIGLTTVVTVATAQTQMLSARSLTRWLGRLSVRRKVGLSMATLIILALVIASAAIGTAAFTQFQIRSDLQLHQRQAALASNITSDLGFLYRFANEYLIVWETTGFSGSTAQLARTEHLTSVAALVRDIRTGIEEYLKAAGGRVESQALRRIDDIVANFEVEITALDQVIEEMGDAERAERGASRIALRARGDQMLAGLDVAIASARQVEAAGQRGQDASIETILATQAQLLAGLASGAFLAVLIGTLIAFILADQITRPIQALSAAAQRFSRGDLSARADIVAQDEISLLAGTFNRMGEQLQTMLAHLERAVAQRTEQLQASAEVGRAAASILDPNQLLREVVNLITNRFGYYYAAVFTLDGAGKFAVLREATGEAGQTLKQRGHQLEVGGQSMVGYATAQRKPRIALDVGDAERVVRFANPLLPDTRSEIALPLVVGDRVLGALDVQSAQEAAFDEGGMAALQSMADQVAIALANAQSFGALQAALQTTTRLYEVGRALFAAASPREAYAAAVRGSVVRPGLDRVIILTVATRDPDGEPIEYEVAAAWDAPSGTQVEPGARMTPAQFPLLNLVDRASIVVVRNADEPRLPAPTRRALEQAGLKAAVLVPLLVRGQFEGFLAAIAGQPLDFTEGDLRYVQSITEQLALVVGSLRANEETLAALERVALLNRRLSGEAWRRYLASRQDLAAESGRLGAPPDASRLSRPITIRGQTLGLIDLEDADPDRQWTDDEEDLLSAVVGELALAIENARLIEQTQLRAARQAQLNQIAEKIRRASDIQTILQIAVEELSQTLDASHANARLGAPATVAGHRDGASVMRDA